MKIIYIISKIITVFGTLNKAFFEHIFCRKYRIAIEDARYFQMSEMCGHVYHELPEKRSAAFGICFFPMLCNFLVGLALMLSGAMRVIYIGDFSFSTSFFYWGNDSLYYVVLLWLGISCWANLFPLYDDVLNFKDKFYGENGAGMLTKVLVAPVYAVIYAGSFLERTGLTIITTCVAAFFSPYVITLITPWLASLTATSAA
ncbi:MAG: hypothetical protein GX851_07215 [Clostridiales bacterium]|nr:hypothetical protein [Clostridiales bacterium]